MNPTISSSHMLSFSVLFSRNNASNRPYSVSNTLFSTAGYGTFYVLLQITLCRSTATRVRQSRTSYRASNFEFDREHRWLRGEAKEASGPERKHVNTFVYAYTVHVVCNSDASHSPLCTAPFNPPFRVDTVQSNTTASKQADNSR